MAEIDKLMKIKEWNDGDSMWRVACDCMEPNHDAQLWFEPVDKDHTDISLMLSMEVGFYSRWGFWETTKKRVTAAFRILFTGHYTMSGDVILDEAGMKAMKTALDRGQKHAKDCRARWEKQRAEKKNAEISG